MGDERVRVCVPQDAFWQANREIAEWLWRQGDGATISTRVAEDMRAATGVSRRAAKTGLHGVAAIAAGLGTARASGSNLLGVVVGMGVFLYLQGDRC